MTGPHALADVLVAAERDRAPVVPLTRRAPFLTVDAAYATQALVVGQRLARGERVVGAKLGLTSAVKRRALGIDEPVSGRLTSGMLLPPGAPVPLDELIAPRAEPEIAFLVGARIAAPTTVEAVLAATEAVLPAIEVVDSRYAAPFRLADSVADNAGAARVVLGAVGRRPADVVDLSVLGCVFSHRRGVETAAGGAVLGHPAAALVWLADALAARGEAVEPGWVVLSGGLTASVLLADGDEVTAEFDGLGSVGVRATCAT